MPKKYYRLFIKEGGSYLLVGRLMQQKSDESLMLQIEPSKQFNGARVGRVKLTGDEFEIKFEDLSTPAQIEHTSIHASGQSHTKMADGTYSINYGKDNPGIPLRDLKTIKHMGTLIVRKMTDADQVTPSRQTDVVIERSAGQKSSVIDILAVPIGINMGFNADWDMHNDRQVQLTVGLLGLPFNGFNIMLFVRSSDQFDSVPAGTLHLPDMNSLVPFITSMDKDGVRVKLSGLTFEEVIQPGDQADDDPYSGMTVISATPKFL